MPKQPIYSLKFAPSERYDEMLEYLRACCKSDHDLSRLRWLRRNDVHQDECCEDYSRDLSRKRFKKYSTEDEGLKNYKRYSAINCVTSET